MGACAGTRYETRAGAAVVAMQAAGEAEPGSGATRYVRESAGLGSRASAGNASWRGAWVDWEADIEDVLRRSVAFVGEGVYGVLERAGLHTGPVSDPKDAAWLAGGAAALLAVCALAAWHNASLRARRRRQARANAYAVDLAARAPEDDMEEHELEQRTDARAAAPGESDLEEETLAPRAYKFKR